MDTRAEIERIRCYMNRQSDLRLAIVYGSLAGGRARPDGDLDIAGASAMESAMDIHNMVTQSQLIVCVTSPKAMRSHSVPGMEFRFIRCKPEYFFGLADHWVNKQEKVTVSDLERTILDGLRQLEYCGGVTVENDSATQPFPALEPPRSRRRAAHTGSRSMDKNPLY